MNYKQENAQIRQQLEWLFNQAKCKLGSWAEVAKGMGCAYSSVARYRRNLEDYLYPSLTFYFRLCWLVEGRDHSQDGLDRFLRGSVTKVSWLYVLTFSKRRIRIKPNKRRRFVIDGN